MNIDCNHTINAFEDISRSVEPVAVSEEGKRKRPRRILAPVPNRPLVERVEEGGDCQQKYGSWSYRLVNEYNYGTQNLTPKRVG